MDLILLEGKSLELDTCFRCGITELFDDIDEIDRLLDSSDFIEEESE
jgi:hypothetical protein